MGLFDDFFYVPRHARVREKTIIARLTSTVAVVLLCLAAMSLTAYAYFSYDVTLGANTIKAARFTTAITVEDADGGEVRVTTGDHATHAATLTGGKAYRITLQHTPQSTAETGFVVIRARGGAATYHTQQISKNEDGSDDTVSFWLRPTADTVVTFYSHWGTSSRYPAFKDVADDSDRYIRDGEIVPVDVADGTAEEN